VIVRFAVADWPLAEAVIVAVVLEATGVVEIVKVAVVAPEATVTEAGTVAEALLLERLATKPPEGAGLDSVTVPVLEEPPTTELGLRTSDEMVGAVMVRVAVLATELQVAVIVALVVEATAVVVIVKVAVVAPAATVTEAGTVAEPELLVRATVRPPVGAALVMVTVPVEEFPPTTEVGLTLSADEVGAVMVRLAVGEAPLKVAVIVAVVFVATAVVVTVKVAVVAPEATVTDAGVVAELELLLRETTKPEAGAADPMVTVPVDELPPTTVVGETETAVKTGGLTVRVAVAEVLLVVAVIVAVVLAATAVVVTVNVPVMAPEAIVTEAGTVAHALLLERVTTVPPDGAALASVTVPVEEVKPTTVVGLNDSAVTVGAVMVKVAVFEPAL